MDGRLEKYIVSLSSLINIPTVSDVDTPNEEEFSRFRRQLKELFPNVFASFRCEEFHGSILLSRTVETDAEPVLFMSHHDVVSENGTWKHEPFSASLEDGKLYGRGTVDTKENLWAVLTALEELLEEGFSFGSSVYVESACNEETTGSGAREISDELKKRGVRFRFVMDEGGLIVYDPIGGADGYFAMVALGEKDCLELKFTARSPGGHSSTPDKKTNPLSRLAAFVTDVDNRDMFRPKLDSLMLETFRRLSPKMKGALKFVFRHAGCFRCILANILTKFSATANAMVRSTVCFTKAKGSEEFNVIPTEASVTADLRLSHRDVKEDVLRRLRRIAEKYDIEMTEVDPGYSSGICSPETEEFRLLEETVSEHFPGVITVPYLSTGASDSKYFSALSENVFRFAPFTVTDEQLDSMHARDENIDVSTLVPAVDFYKKLIRKL